MFTLLLLQERFGGGCWWCMVGLGSKRQELKTSCTQALYGTIRLGNLPFDTLPVPGTTVIARLHGQLSCYGCNSSMPTHRPIFRVSTECSNAPRVLGWQAMARVER